MMPDAYRYLSAAILSVTHSSGCSRADCFVSSDINPLVVPGEV